MKKHSAALLSFAFLLFFISPSLASAHDLQFSGTIGALLHIEPGDSALAGQPATLIFHFVDTEKKFLPAQCECEVSVTNTDGKKIFSAVLDSNDTSAGDDTRLTTFTFPKVGIYKVAVVGAPLTSKNSAATAATFSPFTISYDIRVEQEGSAAGGASGSGFWSRALHSMHGGMGGPAGTHGFFGGHGLHICLFVLAIGISVGIVIRDKRREKRYTDAQREEKKS